MHIAVSPELREKHCGLHLYLGGLNISSKFQWYYEIGVNESYIRAVFYNKSISQLETLAELMYLFTYFTFQKFSPLSNSEN